MEERRKVNNIWRDEGKRPFRRAARRRQNTFKMWLTQRRIGCESEEWIETAQDRCQWRARVSWCVEHFLTNRATISCQEHPCSMELCINVITVKWSCPAKRHVVAKRERRYSSYSFLTSVLDGGEWSASGPGRALPPGKDPRYSLDRRLGGPQSLSGHRG
jgi:hypothetical protein